MRSAICISLLLVTYLAKAQLPEERKVLTHELELVVENDVFLSLVRDQYYSSGIFASYRHLLDSSKFKGNILSMSRKYTMIQRMYTAKYVDWDELEELDRPYAGLFSLMAQQDFFFRNHQYLGVGFELGWMGPTSFTDEIHETWHGFFGLPDPKGWFSQVNDAPILNAHITHGLQLARAQGEELQADIILESQARFGTVFNSIQEGLLLRFGKMKHIERSSHFGNTLGTLKPLFKSDIAVEAYVFYQPSLQYVFHDGTLEGAFLASGESLFTKEPVDWRINHSFGLYLRYGVFDFNFIVYLQPPETDGVDRHSYAGLELRQRF